MPWRAWFSLNSSMTEAMSLRRFWAVFKSWFMTRRLLIEETAWDSTAGWSWYRCSRRVTSLSSHLAGSSMVVLDLEYGTTSTILRSWNSTFMAAESRTTPPTIISIGADRTISFELRGNGSGEIQDHVRVHMGGLIKVVRLKRDSEPPISLQKHFPLAIGVGLIP